MSRKDRSSVHFTSQRAHHSPGDDRLSSESGSGSGSRSPQPPASILRSPSQDSIGSRRPSHAPFRALSDSGRRAPQHHVRFSTDLERHSVEESWQTNWEDRRPASRGLSINTSNLVPLRVHQSSRSPKRATSSLFPNTALSPPSSPSSGPSRPRSRNRGYSLRRTLFTKNIESQTDGTSPSAIELGEAKGPQEVIRPVDGPTDNRRGSEDKKNDMETTVAETAVASSTSRDDVSTYFSEPSDSPQKRRLSMSISHERWLKRKAITTLIIKRFQNSLDAIRKVILRIKEIPPSEDGRHIDLDPNRTETLIDERTGKPYCGNWIRSSRYSFWSFFPRQFWAQFTKLANFYFLVVAILQMIPGLSTTGTYTTLVPLLIFVGISMGKEGLDDWRRYRLDKEENNRYVSVLRPRNGRIELSPGTSTSDVPASSDSQDWFSIKWKDIKVGDVIKLERDEPVPADIALLHAEGPNGVAYIETMALDGETNLKNRQPCQPVTKACSTVEDICSNGIHFAVEDPNLDLYKFDGNVIVNGQERLPLTNNEIVYRGSILRNTERAVGMVIYTGEECKIRMNANKNPRIKSPALQARVNRVVMLIVLLVVVLAIACTVAYKYWSQDVESSAWYLLQANVQYGPIFTSFLIMFNTMIPISLYVSMEIVKVAQMFLLDDIDMYDEETDTPLEARTSTINEELGQVSYIFSDKTGTLTNNTMRFRKMSVAGTAWFHDFDLREETAKEGGRGKLIHKKRSVKGKETAGRKSNASEARQGAARYSNVLAGVDMAGFISMRGRSRRDTNMASSCRTTNMIEYIQRKPYTVFARKARLFLISIALCHTCIPEDDEHGNISFQASSPDELALVTAAQELGYLVRNRQSNNLTIRSFPNSPHEPAHEVYEILDIIEFSSARKRMSVVVRMPDQRICVFCKGADSILMNLLKRSGLAQEKAIEIERRASKRKAAEASQIIRRNSEYHSRRESGLSRPSMTRRPSSVSGHHTSTLRDSIDVWLRDRETDGGILNRDDDGAFYSPRPSMQLGRGSMAISESGSSVHDEVEDLVEEALVVNEAAVFERCFQHLNDFATEGLRTLLYGHRYLDEATYEQWRKAYHEACTSLVGRQEKIEKAGDEIEQQLELTGATAIEDKLQKGVPEAIDKLRRANIKLWMLTGDKRETAINVGHSCRLVKDYSTLVILDQETGEVERSIVKLTADISKGVVAHSVVVVDGQTLSMIESDATLRVRFFALTILVDSVICCRASPKQKAFLVRSIRRQVKDSVTLAIGDGANDIAMIQEAHVGIGITGKEGLQAARISDYSVAQFRFLLKLLLCHGRWNYIRACKYTLGTFWKEMLFYLTQVLYQQWNGYTGTSLYESWSLSMFNTLFTSLAVIFLGIFTKDLAAPTLLAVPELYNKGQRHAGFNIWLYLGWTFMATCEAMIIYFTMYGLFGDILFNGAGNDIYTLGLLTYSACVIVINTKLQALEVHNKTYLSIIVMAISVGGWFLWNMILSRRYTMQSGKGIYHVSGNFLRQTGHCLSFWVVLLVAVVAVIVFEIAVSAVRANVFSTDVDVFQEYEQDSEIRKRFEEAAAMELQQGWDRGGKKASFEVLREMHEMGEVDEEEARERQVQELLARPRDVESGHDNGAGGDVPGCGARANTGSEIHELFSQGFGTIRKGHLR